MWALAELCRVPYYMAGLLGQDASALAWLRYSAFLVLYPVGFVAELGVDWVVFAVLGTQVSALLAIGRGARRRGARWLTMHRVRWLYRFRRSFRLHWSVLASLDTPFLHCTCCWPTCLLLRSCSRPCSSSAGASWGSRGTTHGRSRHAQRAS